MPAAFEAWNDSGYTQIDSQFPNLRLVQKGSVYCDRSIPNDTQGTGYMGEINVPADAAVIAFRCTSPCASNAIGSSGGVYTHRFTIGRTGGVPNPQWVDYWAFATSPAEVHSGIQVFNQQGVLIFTGKDQPAKILGNRQTLVGFNQVVDWPILSAQYLAVVQNSATYGIFKDTNSATLYHYVGYFAKMLNANTVQISQGDLIAWRSGYAGANVLTAFNNYLFLDVANQ